MSPLPATLRCPNQHRAAPWDAEELREVVSPSGLLPGVDWSAGTEELIGDLCGVQGDGR